jgi:transposase
MGVRAIRARIECDRPTLEHLWRTHCVFNARLRALLTKLFAMRRGELGADDKHRKACAAWVEFVLSRPAKDAVYLLNAVSIEGWKPATAMKMISIKLPKDPELQAKVSRWMEQLDRTIKALTAASAKGKVAYAKQEERDGLPDSLFQPLVRDAIAYMSGHQELLALWHAQHDAWMKEKAAWERDAEHKKYLALRPEFEKFEETAGGKAAKRRGRWHLYMEWLAKHPKLAAWRGGPAVVNRLSADAKARIAKAKPWKKRSVEAEEFWAANPELAALDRLHGTYEREFVRRRKTKKNPDGFDHRPTFTMPDAVLHPRWVLFNAPQTSPPGYRNLVLPKHRGEAGSVDLQVLTGEKSDGEYPANFVTVSYRADARLSCFFSKPVKRVMRKGKGKGEEKDGEAYFFRDDQLRKTRTAKISGAKLLFDNIKLDWQGNLKSATPFVVFTCTIDDEPITERAKAITWSDTGETTKSGKARKKRSLPKGLVTCAIDLGVRNLGFITVAEVGGDKKHRTHRDARVLRSRNLHLDGGPTLSDIGSHKREIRRLRRLRGKPVKGEFSHRRLQQHIDDMGTDRFKKAARAIVNYALNVDGAKDANGKVFPRADVIVLEKLAGFIPDAERERGINRALIAWNRGQLVQRLQEVATDAGFKGRVFEVHPAGSSQCCSRCGALGRRYSIVRERDTGKPVIRFGWVEKLFACAECGYRANADHNASVNLHHVFADGSETMAAAFYAWKKLSADARKNAVEALDSTLLHQLQHEHSLPLDSPF